MYRFARIGAGLLLSIAGFADGASAADLPTRVYTKAPAVAPVMTYSWTGCYIGGNVGAGSAHTRQNFAPPFAGALFSDSQGTGVIGGAQVGCDYQFDRVVIGAQGQFDFGRINSSAVEPLFPTFTSAAQTKQIFTATGRVGYLATPAVLAYVKGGAAWAQTNLSVTGSVPVTFLSESATLNRSGWTVGGGAEWMFLPGWSVFAEYNYMDFGNGLVQYVAGPNTRGAPNVLDTKLTTETGLVGVNYKFGWGGPVGAHQ
jgi:outer membrane immunogenic protein